ncbi:26S proteasome non-ATPase regulatory subunit 10, partial [Fusarium oxysporum f. sp. albedinis]
MPSGTPRERLVERRGRPRSRTYKGASIGRLTHTMARFGSTVDRKAAQTMVP